MADQAVDKDGNVYEKGIDGLYLPKYGSSGYERRLSRYQQCVQPDVIDLSRSVLSQAGQPKEGSEKEPLPRTSTSGAGFAERLAGYRPGALLVGGLLVGGLLYAVLRVKLESRDSMFWVLSLAVSIWALSSEPSSSIPWPNWWLAISRWPRKSLLNSVMFVVAGTLLLHWTFVTYAPASTSPPTLISNLSPSTASPSNTASDAIATTPVPQATPTVEPRVWAVGNTDGMGVYLRSEPVMSARVGAAYPDGTRLTQEGSDIDGDGHTWKRVRAPDWRQGYVPSEYVVSTR